MVEYEDELDLLAVVVTNGEEGEGRAHIRLHDNQSGQLLRTVDLIEPWDEVSDYSCRYQRHTELFLYVNGFMCACFCCFRLFDMSCSSTKTQ